MKAWRARLARDPSLCSSLLLYVTEPEIVACILIVLAFAVFVA